MIRLLTAGADTVSSTALWRLSDKYAILIQRQDYWRNCDHFSCISAKPRYFEERTGRHWRSGRSESTSRLFRRGKNTLYHRISDGGVTLEACVTARPVLNELLSNSILLQILKWFIGIPHRSTKADVYKGYYIPAKTIVMGNSWWVFYVLSYSMGWHWWILVDTGQFFMILLFMVTT